MQWQAEVKIMPKKSIRDPQGEAVEGALKSLGYQGAGAVRIGKLVTFSVQAGSKEEAEQTVADACRRLLANPVIEDYSFNLKQF